MRATVVLAALLALLVAAAPGPDTAEAQSPPTLAGENLVSENFTTVGTCEAVGPSTYSFEASGTAAGPYVGTFTESGTFTLGPDVGTNNRGVLAFESTFRIEADNGAVITGTKRLLQSDSGNCLESAEQPRLVNISARVEYEAAITDATGTHSVRGEAVVRATEATAGSVFPEPQASFTETFVTSSPVVLPPAVVVLDPPAAVNTVGDEHCVTATVRDASGQPSAGVTVRFSVAGANSASGSAETDGAGQARFCYTGTQPGTDSISAYADSDGDGTLDAGEPVGEATKTWEPAQPRPVTVTLDPPAATNPVGTEHCVTATVRDAAGQPLEGVTVRFRVTGVSNASGSATTGADGTAEFCYQGPATPGEDVIRAYADSDGDGTEDPGEPFAVATKTFVPEQREPATVTVDPPADTNPVDTEHCVTATVRDAAGRPVEDVSVRFAVTGASAAAGTDTTDEDGRARFCYDGPPFPGADAIRAYADSDGDGTQDAGEPSGAASKAWVLPASSPKCKAIFGGHIEPIGGGKATFAGFAFVHEGEPRGAHLYVDHGRKLKVVSDDVKAIVCGPDGKTARIYGEARANGETTLYRLRVTDVADPGSGRDTYGILLASGYYSGEQTLKAGNVYVSTNY